MYYFFKYNLLLLSTVFFRKVHFNGFEKLPKGKPILFASNHSNSFLDGIMLEVYLLRTLYVLVRGDVFESKFSNWFYRGVRLLPIYRKTDGDPRQTIGKNNEMFDECYDFFKKGRHILIFSEAISVTEKKVRPVRKGTARMAFDMATRDDFGLDLQVVPMGINYTHFKGYGKELMVSFGEAMPVSDYKDLYQQSKAKATNKLTKDIEDSIKAEVVEIDSEELYQVADLYLDTKRTAMPAMFGKFHWNRKRLASEQEHAKQFNDIVASEPSFANKLADFGHMLQQNRVKVRGLNRPKFPWGSLLNNILTLPLAIIGFVLYHFIPIVATNKAHKIAKQDQFKDSLIFGFSMGLFVLVHIIVCTALVIAFGWLGFLLFPLVYIFKYAYFNWKHRASNLAIWMRTKSYARRDPEGFKKMQDLNHSILNAEPKVVIQNEVSA